ncbi:MAG: hypothetical protein M9933_01075 [Chitinophagaceae bacterium]|nr:hypothetical protein [Chitinophagaceae bacterium]
MNLLNEHIDRVNEKLQLLVKQYQALQKENERLKQELEQRGLREQEMTEKITRLQQQMEIARVYSGQTEGDNTHKELEKRINAYIKEIDQCIALLSGQ